MDVLINLAFRAAEPGDEAILREMLRTSWGIGSSAADTYANAS